MFGAFFGLFAILLGALFNAKLNRDRDERLSMQDRQALAGGLKGELFVICGLLQGKQESLLRFKKTMKNANPQTTLTIRYKEQYNSSFYKSTTHKLGILGAPIVAEISAIYEFISFLESEKERTIPAEDHFLHILRVTELQKLIVERISRFVEELEHIELGGSLRKKLLKGTLKEAIKNRPINKTEMEI